MRVWTQEAGNNQTRLTSWSGQLEGCICTLRRRHIRPDGTHLVALAHRNAVRVGNLVGRAVLALHEVHGDRMRRD